MLVNLHIMVTHPSPPLAFVKKTQDKNIYQKRQAVRTPHLQQHVMTHFSFPAGLVFTNNAEGQALEAADTGAQMHPLP